MRNIDKNVLSSIVKIALKFISRQKKKTKTKTKQNNNKTKKTVVTIDHVAINHQFSFLITFVKFQFKSSSVYSNE